MQINSNYQKPVYNASFTGKHLPRTFSSMMNYLYKDSQKYYGDFFECCDTVKISTTLKSGEHVSGVVNFFNGKYAGLQLDEGCEQYRQKFIRTILEKYNKSVAKGNTRKKLGY